MKSNRKIRPTTAIAAAVAALAIAALAWRSASPGSSQQESRQREDVHPEVPYVPTREDVMNEMFKMAKVTKDDLVYDLGSGDGRIVIAAAKQFGARGVGIDIDPQRIEESNENAKKAGVTDKVQFIEGDLFDAELSKATVVTLYLLPSVNLRLRPKLLKELKPGTRVVSHNYDMGDWKPDKQTQIGDHLVFLWVIPDKPMATH
jgi:SAM-dependent methyltransferase